MKLHLSVVCLVAAVVIPCVSTPAQTTERVNVDSAGVQANSPSFAPSPVSADGRYVAFYSAAAKLVDGDTNEEYDVFVHDRISGTTERVSVATGGGQGNYGSYYPSMSADGRYVAFSSDASTLVLSDTNGARDVFVRDRLSGLTERVSVATGGAQGNASSDNPSISADGRYVGFSSSASNLVAGDTNGTADVFVHDLLTGRTRRVSVDSAGTQGNGDSGSGSISADGRYLAFASSASNLVAGDSNGFGDVFVHDLISGTTERVSIATGGAQGSNVSGSPSISSDGRYVAFDSLAANLVPVDTNGARDVFVRDRLSGTTERVSVATGGAEGDFDSANASISADGRYVAFDSVATNLVPSDTNGGFDVFEHDRLFGTTERASIAFSGTQGNATSEFPAISAAGRYVTFQSSASNLVPDDTNGWVDIFIRDRGAGSSFTAFCFGDGNVAACPCKNSGQTAHGCENSAGTGGAVLSASGEASLSSATVQLTSSGELPSAMSIAFQGNSAISPVLYGDGLRCLSGTLLRLYIKSAVGGSISVPEAGDPSIPIRSAILGDPIPLGASRFYHVYYRDERPSFCPAPLGELFNVTHAIAIAWGA